MVYEQVSSTEAGQEGQDQESFAGTGRPSQAKRTLEITTTAETQTHSGKVQAVTLRTAAMSLATCQYVEPIH